jgi:HEAT repeats
VATPGPSVAQVDAAIIGCLTTRSGSALDAALDRAVVVGEGALRRAVELYYGHSTWVNPPRLEGSGRELADAWSCLLFRLAMAFPGVYLDEINARRIWLKGPTEPVSEVMILGCLDDARAVPLLVQCCRHRHWLVRYHAVRGLVRRDDPASVAAVERAARLDCSVSVRIEAAGGVLRRDPQRGRALHRALLEHPHLTPMLRERVEEALKVAASTSIN